MARWLEISADYRCNNRCVGCFSVADDGPSMTSAEAVHELRLGRESGATSLWLGGGEPTLRRDLVPLVRAARQLGYTQVKLQTNGLLLAYRQLVERLVQAGVTEISLSLKAATAEAHERRTRTPHSFPLLLQAIDEWRRTGLPLEGDVLVYRESVGELPDIVRFFHARGVSRFLVWALSAEASSDPEAQAQVPRLSDVARAVVETRALGLSDRPDFLTSLHTPPCLLPPAHHASLFHAPALDLVVANPGGHRFRLEESPIEGGHFLPRCDGCRMRARCNGLREGYVAQEGDAEFQPLP